MEMTVKMTVNKDSRPQNVTSTTTPMTPSRSIGTRNPSSIQERPYGHSWSCAIRYANTFWRCLDEWHLVEPILVTWQDRMLTNTLLMYYRPAQHLPWFQTTRQQQSSRRPMSWVIRPDRTNHAHAEERTSIVWSNLEEQRLITTAIREYHLAGGC